MTVEANPSARVQVRSASNLMHPGSCMICGSGDAERTYLDLSTFYDYEGQQYICVEYCCRELTAAIGALMPDEALFLIEQNNKYEARSVELEKVKEHYDRLVTALGSIGDIIGSDFTVARSDDIIASDDVSEQHGDPLTNDQSTIDGTKELTDTLKSVASRTEHVGTSQSAISDGTLL